MAERSIALMNAAEIARALAEMARAITAQRRGQIPIALVGIRTRGVPLAARLAQQINGSWPGEPQVGAIDITLYRDDLSQIAHNPVLHGTDVPFSVDGKELILVDDVLFTGRTVRAAIDAVCDLGRPASLRLAVLVDRGHRELPIQPDVVGLRIETEWTERIEVRLLETDGEDAVRRERDA